MGLGQPNLISSPGTSDPCPVTHTRRTHTAFALCLSLACLGKTDCSTQNVWRLVCCAKPPLTVSGYTVRTPFTICASCPLAPPSPRPLSLSSSCGRPKTQKGRHVSTFCHKPILAKRRDNRQPKRGLTSPSKEETDRRIVTFHADHRISFARKHIHTYRRVDEAEQGQCEDVQHPRDRPYKPIRTLPAAATCTCVHSRLRFHPRNSEIRSFMHEESDGFS